MTDEGVKGSGTDPDPENTFFWSFRTIFIFSSPPHLPKKRYTDYIVTNKFLSVSADLEKKFPQFCIQIKMDQSIHILKERGVFIFENVASCLKGLNCCQ